MDRDFLEKIAKVVYYAIIITGLISILSILGIKPAGFLLAGSVAGLVVGFASQNIVGNLVSGIFLMIEKPFKIGDQIHISDIAGFVDDIRMISSTIRKYDKSKRVARLLKAKENIK